MMNETDQTSTHDSTDVFSSKIGIICPPPEVKAIVDKTALFVAKNGMEFEERIRANEANNLKFNFMNQNDPYYGYYQYKLKDNAAKISNPPADTEELLLSKETTTTGRGGYEVEMVDETTAAKEEEIIVPGSVNYYEKLMQNTTPSSYEKIVGVPKYGEEELQNMILPKPYEFMSSHPNILLMDIDIMKITAQFVAKGGRLFLNNLMQREQRNYFFDFLKPQHSLYAYFLSLVDQYTKIINPSPSMLDSMRNSMDNNQSNLIESLQVRCFFEKQRVDQKEIEDEANEKDRIAFAQIDWHDFVIVEQVSFKEDDKTTLPHPVSLEKLGERLLAQEHYEAMRREQEEKKYAATNNTESKSTSMVNNVSAAVSNGVSETATSAIDDTMSIVADNDDVGKPSKRRFEPVDVSSSSTVFKKAGLISSDSGSTARNKDNLMISPITGELIPADSIAEHMRINLLDPRYKEQKERLFVEKKQQDEVYTVGSSMVSHLKELAQRRSDIFGPSTQEIQIGKKLEDYQPVTSSKTAVPIVNVTTPSSILSNTNVNDMMMISGDNSHNYYQQSKFINPTVPTPIMSTVPINANVITKVPEGLSQPPKYPQMMPGPGGAIMFPPSAAAAAAATTQAQLYNTHNTPVGLPPPIFNPMASMLPPPMMRGGMPPMNHMMNLGHPLNNNHVGVGLHGLPPPSLATAGTTSSSANIDPFAKQANPIESMLIPEAVFLSSNSKHEITLKIKMPQNDELTNKHGWKLNGQFESIPSNMTWKISQLKAEITKAIGMPTSKQKLTIGQGFFMKDANTLAYYNLMDSSFVNLQIKERGGKNK